MARDHSAEDRADGPGAGSGAGTGGGAGSGADHVDVPAYLRRIGVDPATVGDPDLTTLERLQRAHVTTVPFETFAIVGDPTGGADGEGVTLSVPHLHRKVVERGLGGYCFELNGLFAALLDGLGYDVDRVSARVLREDATTPPANHHAIVVELDRRYLVDVGILPPSMRIPVPLDGAVRDDGVDAEWRVAPSDRPDETAAAQYRGPGEVGIDAGDGSGWATRYVFSDVPRALPYFEATCDYLQSAPESGFTGDPIVSIATERGHRTLSGTTLTELVDGRRRERTVPEDEWWETVRREFGLEYDHG